MKDTTINQSMINIINQSMIDIINQSINK